MQERRTFQRFQVDVPVKFVNLDTKKEGLGKMINISASGGGLIIMGESLAPATPLEMHFLIPDNKDPLCANGKVIWSNMIQPEVYMAGIQFEKVDFMGIARALRLRTR